MELKRNNDETLGGWLGTPGVLAADEACEPMEYLMLDYIGLLPDELSDKLRQSLEEYEATIQRLSRRNRKLLARAEAAGGELAVAGSTKTEEAAAVNGDPLARSHAQYESVELRIAAAQESRLRRGAEAHEAAMRSRLEHTSRAAKARLAAMAGRAQREEEECLHRTSAARAERNRLQEALARGLLQQNKIKKQIADLEASIKEEDDRCFVADRLRRARARDLEALRSELKEHRARANRHRAREQRVHALQRELNATLAALGEKQPPVFE
jgi:chromosome segregation ATPase